jgi:hypothetical protein
MKCSPITTTLRVAGLLLLFYIFLSVYYTSITRKLIEKNENKVHEISQLLKNAATSDSSVVKSDIPQLIPQHIKENLDTPDLKHDASRFHAVTYASHGGRDDRFCRAIESSLRHNVNLIILGWGVPWQGLSQKLDAAHNFASSLPASDIMLFTDAFDVMFTDGPENLLKNYVTLNADIVFAGECGCWPHIMENKGIECFSKYPSSPTPYRYLNSGTWIGRAQQSTKMLAAVIIEAGKLFTNANDQKLVADMFMNRRFNITLDYYASLFQSMHMTVDRKLLPYCNPYEDILIKNDGRFFNRRTNTTPSVFHFNGGGKIHHLEMEGKLWYKQPRYNTRDEIDKLRSSLISAPLAENPSRKIRFDSMCPKYFK